MKRRDLLAMLGATLAAPTTARARGPLAHVGALVVGSQARAMVAEQLSGGLRDLGYVEQRDVVIDVRSADGQLDRLPALAAELVGLPCDIIVALYTPCALAARQATRTIPIVILSGDPVATGLVADLAHPGGNITGLSQMAAETHGKCVELFRDLRPTIRSLGVVSNAADPSFAKPFLEQVRRFGATAGLAIDPVLDVRAPGNWDDLFAAIAASGAGGAVVQGSLPPIPVTQAALRHRVPVASTPRAFAENGGLMCYTAVDAALFRRAAWFVHRILQGAKPADLPIEQASDFELIVNLGTARSLGIAVSPAFLGRADEVIE